MGVLEFMPLRGQFAFQKVSVFRYSPCIYMFAWLNFFIIAFELNSIDPYCSNWSGLALLVLQSVPEKRTLLKSLIVSTAIKSINARPFKYTNPKITKK